MQQIGDALHHVLEWVLIIFNGLKDLFAPIIISSEEKRSLLYQCTIGLYTTLVVPSFTAIGIPEFLVHFVFALLAIFASYKFLKKMNII